MSPELKQTLEIIFSIGQYTFVAGLIVALIIKDLKYKKLVSAKKSEILKLIQENMTFPPDYIFEHERMKDTIKQCEFVMAIADEISADMFKDNERLHCEVELLKAKLNHKKRPTK